MKRHHHRTIPGLTTTRGYSRPVAPAGHEVPGAHGGVENTYHCGCGATRKANVNGDYVEWGVWTGTPEPLVELVVALPPDDSCAEPGCDEQTVYGDLCSYHGESQDVSPDPMDDDRDPENPIEWSEKTAERWDIDADPDWR
jgi:hypothetical protein